MKGMYYTTVDMVKDFLELVIFRIKFATTFDDIAKDNIEEAFAFKRCHLANMMDVYNGTASYCKGLDLEAMHRRVISAAWKLSKVISGYYKMSEKLGKGDIIKTSDLGNVPRSIFG